MESWYWILWSILGAILIVAEVFTAGFVLLWFGIGALVAAFAGILGINSLGIQFLIFAFVSIGLTAAFVAMARHRGESCLARAGPAPRGDGHFFR